MEDTLADDLRMALEELLSKADLQDPDFLREGVRLLAQEVMELEVSQHLGAERYERSAERRGHRNGNRERPWDTRVGTIELHLAQVTGVLETKVVSIMRSTSVAEGLLETHPGTACLSDAQ
jgi:transposase-like protein